MMFITAFYATVYKIHTNEPQALKAHLASD